MPMSNVADRTKGSNKNQSKHNKLWSTMNTVLQQIEIGGLDSLSSADKSKVKHQSISVKKKSGG